jgi:hypothetical protein
MKLTHILLGACVAGLFTTHFISAQEAGRQLPPELENWQDWVLREEGHQDCPTPYNDSKKHLCYWPSEFELFADGAGAQFRLKVSVFNDGWISLPGSGEHWPLQVRVNGSAQTVIQKGNHPSVKLPKGVHNLSGSFIWDEMPQKLRLPRTFGVVKLRVDGKDVSIPNWDASGQLWLKRTQSEQSDRDSLAIKVYRVIRDGIPMWLDTEVELSVAGKSREETLGHVLPDGWILAQVESAIPVAVDEEGLMKAQVRSGKWIIQLKAFRTHHPEEIAYRAGTKPLVESEYIGFQGDTKFRMVEVRGIPQIDISQTTFPQKWANLPVYLWENTSPFQLEERMRGMGFQKPEGLRINRELWIDGDGRGMTFRDRINGTMQQIWRLDVAEGRELGAVRIDGEGQLVTENPESGAQGVEIRTRNLNLEAVGRDGSLWESSATGWLTSADSVSTTINMPPGWRLFALFGADYVNGDWLTAWKLSDLFLLLIFALAVYRLWGIPAGVVAFLAFGLAYHEPEAPVFAWFFLLVPLALLRVTPAGTIRKIILVWKYVAIAVLVGFLIPLYVHQIQGFLYPQLERSGTSYGAPTSGVFGGIAAGQVHEANAAVQSVTAANAPAAEPRFADEQVRQDDGTTQRAARGKLGKKSWVMNSNLAYDAKARIQTGPGVPEWRWNAASFGWNGPVAEGQQIKPIFISLTAHRGLTALRLAFIIILIGILLKINYLTPPFLRAGRAGALVMMLGILGAATPATQAEIPDQNMLNELKQHLLKPSDAYPHAADIASVALDVKENSISMLAEIHTAEEVAVPLPGRLQAWSPVTVTLDGSPNIPLKRFDGYLWAVLPKGVHQVRVEGLLPNSAEWEWSFQLVPRRVEINAPGWIVTGVRENGRPEAQVFFVRQQKKSSEEAAYDRKDFNPIVIVDRYLEIGLVWQVRTVVSRVSSAGKAVSLEIPLLPGEQVFTNDVVSKDKDGIAEVRLGAQQNSFTWRSELREKPELQLKSVITDQWVERWTLETSPVWNISLDGLSPIFEQNNAELKPVWHPWPGESVTLNISRPSAVSGDTVTIKRVHYETSVGKRQSKSTLKLDIECSLGEDFVLGIPEGAEILSLKRNNQMMPVRQDGSNVIIPLQPGEQSLLLNWREATPLGLVSKQGAIVLPVEAANVTSKVQLPQNRWILWTGGPQRGPAVRFWTVLACALLIAWLLSKLSLSPLKLYEWVLLALGLTQVHLALSIIVLAWLFLLGWRGKIGVDTLKRWQLNTLQIIILLLTVGALVSMLFIVGEGLLGRPEMFIIGNGSYGSNLIWFEPRVMESLPQPFAASVTIWVYRLLMLLWALWLAVALIKWLRWGWDQFRHESVWFRKEKEAPKPPPLS